MDDSDLLAFTPVPLRARRDGWTVKKQHFFILGLARGLTPGDMAARLGLTRKTAYDLCRKPGGEGFAAAWGSAVALARGRRIARQGRSLIDRGLHGEWIPRLYRGRIVGWTHRTTSAGLMRVLGRLDRLAERLPPGAATPDFDQLCRALRAERDSPDRNTGAGCQYCHVPEAGDAPDTSPHPQTVRPEPVEGRPFFPDKAGRKGQASTGSARTVGKVAVSDPQSACGTTVFAGHSGEGR